ncbi:MAG: LysR family transcriptional regulator [Methanobrevibacter sp.]|jgi:molybdenum-dependent DNA-binding transcriptional regulator ModE|nr:LysR family transcriptional regulator [Candidatus Methanovirga meridionalis]
MKFKAKIGMEIDGKNYDHRLFKTLEIISKTFSQRKAANDLDIAHSVLNRRIKNAEDKLGFQLVQTNKSGTKLTIKGHELLKKYSNYQNRVSEAKKIMIYGGPITIGILEYLSSGFPMDVGLYSCSDEDSYSLGKRNLVDILALDDPLLGFKKDLEFIPIAHDYLVLVSNEEKMNIKYLDDLNNLNFVSVNGTAQRLAWQTLKDNNINFNIIKTLNSQYDAFKLVKNSQSLYTFLNGSFFKGNDILKRETEHVISLVPLNNDKTGVNEFINYVLDSSKEIAKQGFKPMKPWKV